MKLRHVLLPCGIGLLAVGFLWPVADSWLYARRGPSDAAADIEQGKLRYTMCSTKPRWFAVAKAALKSEYGVDLKSCDAAEARHFEYLRRYNQTVVAHLVKTYGRDVIGETLRKYRSAPARSQGLLE